jgi:nucleoside-diphosphate kinase
MAIEQTLSIIKPDAIAKNIIGQIYSRFEDNGLRIVAAKMIHLKKEEAERFYAIHRGRPFYNWLVEFMSSDPVMVQVLEGENAIMQNRELMGATDPQNAEPDTIRYDFARDNDESGKNATHGSDSPENARVEIDFFFKAEEIHSSNR